MKEKTAPWLPMNASWWPEISNQLPRPWPQEAVYMDLRWWEDQEAQGRTKRPGRAALCLRWGWKEKRARISMRNGSEWERASEGPAKGQPRASEGPKNEPQVFGITEPRGLTRASEGPAKGQRRAPRAELQNTKQNTEQIKTLTSDKPSPVERVKPVRGVFDEIVRLRLEAWPGARELTLTKARAQILKARITEHSGEDVIAVVKWWLESTHPRAGYLRENGHGIDTLLRASNFAKYLEFSQEQPRKPKPKATAFSVPPPAPRQTNEPPALSLYTERQIAAVKADLEDLQATCKPETWERMVRTALAQSYGQA